MKRAYLLAVIVCLVAVSVRLVPLSYSALPYNIDGFSLVSIAERTRDYGHLNPVDNDPNMPNYKVPYFAIWLTMFSQIVGVEPLYISQPMIPFLTIPVILIVFALVRRLTKSDIAASVAALFLGIEGLYVFSTATVIKASIAFALIPLVVYLYWFREDPRKRALAAFLLLILPLVHHLSSLIVFSTISLMLFNDILIWWRNGSLTKARFATEMVLGPLLFIPGLIHYNLVDLKYFREVYDVRQILLFFSVLFIAAIVYRNLSLPLKYKRNRDVAERKRWKLILDNKIVYPIGAVVLLLINYRTNIFTGTIQTKPTLLEALVFYVILTLMCLIGFNLIRKFKNQFRPLVMALIMAPFSIMVFAFLRGLDPLSFLLMYRTFPYMMFGVSICAGVGIAYLISLSRHNAAKVMIVSCFTVLLLLSLPLGYNSEAMYDVENATAQYEFAAMEHMSIIDASFVGTDQRISDVMHTYFHQDGDGFLPDRLYRDSWRDQYDYILVLSVWSTQGAQRYPLPNLVFGADDMTLIANENDVVYTISSPLGMATILHMR